jgi:hypothetical protein
MRIILVIAMRVQIVMTVDVAKVIYAIFLGYMMLSSK